MRAVESELSPCICTRLNEGDDYGLDAFVQYVHPGRPARRTSLQFGLQVKGTSVGFESYFAIRLKVSSLCDWQDANQPVIVAVHSLQSQATRWRMASEIVAQLDQASSSWRSQSTVSVPFEVAHELAADKLHAFLWRGISGASDTGGGSTRFHVHTRSVLLTELYHGYAYTGQHADISSTPGGSAVGHFITGMQWKKGEVDERAVVATRVLTAALLLFDEVYYPAHLTYAAVGAVGSELFLRLLDQRRLIPVLLPQRELVFLSGADRRAGDLYFMNADMAQVLERELRGVQTKHGLGSAFGPTVVGATRILDLPARVDSELLEVSKLPYVRDLLSLGVPRPQGREPVWAAERLLRVGQVVKYYAIADLLRVDVVEFEPGLSRLALARWGSRVRFHRVYQALDELQRTFDAAALPDLGVVAERIGSTRCIDISSTHDGADFRKWFWEAAADALATTGSFEGDIARRIKSLTGNKLPLPRELLIQFTQTSEGAEGLVARPRGDEALARQKKFSAARLRDFLTKETVSVPAKTAQCPCGSEVAFGQCCGRVFPQD